MIFLLGLQGDCRVAAEAGLWTCMYSVVSGELKKLPTMVF